MREDIVRNAVEVLSRPCPTCGCEAYDEDEPGVRVSAVARFARRLAWATAVFSGMTARVIVDRDGFVRGATIRREDARFRNGEVFDLTGYDLVASAQVAEGGGPPEREEVVVVNNNHNYYLVAFRERDGETGRLIASFRYGDSVDVEEAYEAALQLMARTAVEN